MPSQENAKSSVVADPQDSPQKYLSEQELHFGSPFEVLIVCNIIFHQDRVLLLRLKDEPALWKDKIGVPMLRLSRTDRSGVGRVMKSPVDHVMSEEVSVEEYARVATRTQIGLDPSRLEHSQLASALHTAVSPEGLEESVWLRASILWAVEEAPPLKADGYVCNEAFWAGEEEFKKMPGDKLAWGIRNDILTVFDLVRKRQEVEGKLESWSWK